MRTLGRMALANLSSFLMDFDTPSSRGCSRGDVACHAAAESPVLVMSKRSQPLRMHLIGERVEPTQGPRGSCRTASPRIVGEVRGSGRGVPLSLRCYGMACVRCLLRAPEAPASASTSCRARTSVACHACASARLGCRFCQALQPATCNTYRTTYLVCARACVRPLGSTCCCHHHSNR